MRRSEELEQALSKLDPGERAIWAALDDLAPLRFLEVMGFGHGYSTDIGKAARYLYLHGWTAEQSTDRAIELLRRAPADEIMPRWRKPI